MTLPYLTSVTTVLTMSEEYDTLSLRNRDVTETLSSVADLGQDKKEEPEPEKYDTLELRNRTVTETLSPLEDLGQDKKEEKIYDELELRNRTVTETLSPLEDLGQDKKDETEPAAKKPKYD